MSSQRIRVYPPNPSTTRGTSTKLGSHGDKVIYANGKSIVVRSLALYSLLTRIGTLSASFNVDQGSLGRYSFPSCVRPQVAYIYIEWSIIFRIARMILCTLAIFSRPPSRASPPRGTTLLPQTFRAMVRGPC